MRTIDRLTVQDSQIASLQLMENAAKACFLEIKKFYSGELAGKKALILCGTGNNGGDGAALAQQLFHAGVHADVIILGNVARTKGDARANFESVQTLANSQDASTSTLTLTECDSDANWQALRQVPSSYDLIVDAIFGTGLSRPLEGIFLTVVKCLRKIQADKQESSRPPLILSVDVPSGLNADLPNPFYLAVQADRTVTFTAPKAANVLPPASDCNGMLVVADIGSPQELLEAALSDIFVVQRADARAWLLRTRYEPGSFKNTHGHVLVIAGSRGYTGAAVLCGNAAMRSGAGLVTIATPASAHASIASTAMSELMTESLAETDRGAVSDAALVHIKRLASKASVIAIGPGLSAEDERTRRFVYSVVKDRQVPVIIDADALNCLAPWPPALQGSKEAPLVLTPHPGEMLRLLGTDDRSMLNDRVGVARDFATRHCLILVLKGSRALIAAGGHVYINPTGNAGLGTAGSGDTLTGIIAGFVAQEVGTLGKNADVLSATLAALYIGGMAGDMAAQDIGMRSMVASDIREYLSKAIRSLDPKGEQPKHQNEYTEFSK